MSSSEVLDLVGSLVWPTIVLVALLIFRRPLASALNELGRRATKLDLRVVTLEFRPELAPDWRVDMGGSAIDVRRLTSDAVFDSYSMTLFGQLTDPTTTDVLEMDLGDGVQWLTTRLYLFSMLLERLRGVRCIVVLQTKDDRGRQVVGSASPAAIGSALSADEPWLEPTYISAWNEALGVQPTAGHQIGDAFADDLTFRQFEPEPLTAQKVARVFVRLNQRSTAPVDNPSEWQEFESSEEAIPAVTIWEHTQWINPAALPTQLSRVLDTRSLVHVDPTASQSDLKQQILLQEGPFVVLIETDGTLRGVVERATMLDEAMRVALGKGP